MFRLIDARNQFWRYHFLIHFTVVQLCVEELLQGGVLPSDTLLDSLAATAGTAAQWLPGLVAAA